MNQALQQVSATEVRDRAESVAAMLRALGNRHRLLILCHLLEVGEASAGELARHLELGGSALSQHLKRMRAEALVACRRQARTVLYRVGDLGDSHLAALLEGICAPVTHRDTRAAGVRAALQMALGVEISPADGGDWQSPAVASAGPVRRLPEVGWQPDPDATYKLVFTLGAATTAPAALHAGLVRVARALNLYAVSGVVPPRLACVLVIAGPASDVVLGDDDYRRRHDALNPNLAVLRELRAAGVEIVVCGQTLAARGLAAERLDPAVTVALSALTTQAELQRRGYALMPV